MNVKISPLNLVAFNSVLQRLLGNLHTRDWWRTATALMEEIQVLLPVQLPDALD